jgi:hypothetical protein|tara:strand:- start:176 stop:376 length:201 start_codon:yes stop_codon:yes gene_type:complete
MENFNKRKKPDLTADFDPDNSFSFEIDDREPRPIIGSDSSDGEISDLEDSDEGFGFVTQGNLSKKH